MNALTELLNEPVTNRINQRDLPEDNITDGNDRSAMPQLGVLAAAPATDRRSFLIGTMGLATAASIGQLLHAEEVIDPDKMTASEYLKRFPESMTLPDGGKVEIEKFEVQDAKQCLLILPWCHPESHALKPELQRIADQSHKELGLVIAHLSRKWGVKHFLMEGYTREEFIIHKLWGKKALTPAEKALLDQAIATLQRFDPKFISAEQESRNVEYELSTRHPSGMYDLYRKGLLALLPGETEEAYQAAGREKREKHGQGTDRIALYNREDECIKLRLKTKETVAATLWGPDHWPFVPDDTAGRWPEYPDGKYGGIPKRVLRHNFANRGQQLCGARLKTLAARQVYTIK